jgi:outer membrane biosynthesis protein TonB
VAPALKRGATFSAILHLLVLLALILVIPPPVPPPPLPDESMAVEFTGGTAASAQKSQDRGTVAAPAESDHPAPDNPALVKPRPAPIEKAPPPPPPPPKSPAPQTVQTLQPQKLPPPPPALEAESIRPPPPVKVPPTRQPEQTQEKPLDTVTHQPNHTKNPAPDTKSFDNTMEKLLAINTQTAPPKHVYNPDRGGARNAGGQVHGNLTGSLTEGQRKTIGDEVRRCYAEDTAAKDYATYSARMVVTVDQQGVARDARLAPADFARAGSDPAFRAFAERAVQAVLDPTCAQLPLPPDKLGQTAQLTFTFRP